MGDNLLIFLADLTAFIHFLYILFVVGGQALIMLGWVRQWRWTRQRLFRLLHLAAIGLVVIEVWSKVYCPLTVLESHFRQHSSDSIYTSGFISYWIGRLIYYNAPEWVFILLYSLFFIVVVVTYLVYPPRRAKNND